MRTVSLATAVKPRCRYCGSRVAYFGDVCAADSESVVNDLAVAVDRAMASVAADAEMGDL